MSTMTLPAKSESLQQSTGTASASLFSAAIGSFSVAGLTILSSASASFKTWLAFYKPAGALSGIAALAVFIWIASWLILDRLWRKRTIDLRKIAGISALLLLLSLFGTFPPIYELFH